jgi:hypothetical protein
MWCRECYFLNPDVLFHVKQWAILDKDGNENDPVHQQQLQATWGRKQQAPDDFLWARDGNHAMVPFECDLCLFRKLRKCYPNPDDPQDKLLLGCIRRVNLDTFWSRATGTVKENQDKIDMAISLSKTVGLLGPYEALGPLPKNDHCGYKVAIEMVLQSCRPGKYSPDYTQFDSIRKLVFSNHCRASAQSNHISFTLGDQKGKYQHFLAYHCSSFWFYHFIKGA